MDNQDQEPTYALSQTIEAYASNVRCLSSNDNTFICGSYDRVAKVYSYETHYEQVNQMGAFKSYIYAVCHLVDGGFAIAYGNVVELHDAQCNLIRVLEGHTNVVNSLSSASANTLISGSWDATAIVWNTVDGTIVHRLEGHSYGVAVLAIDYGKQVLTGSQDGILRHWSEGRQVNSVKAHDDIIREIAFVPGVGYLTCSNDCSIKVWSHSLEILITMRGHDGFVFTCKPLLYKCLQYYVSGADDNKVKLWDEDGNEVQSLDHPDCVWSLGINASTGDIISGCGDGQLRIFTHNPQISLAQPSQEKASPALITSPILKTFSLPKHAYSGDEYFPSGEYDFLLEYDVNGTGNSTIPCNLDDIVYEVAEMFCQREQLGESDKIKVVQYLKQNMTMANLMTKASMK